MMIKIYSQKMLFSFLFCFLFVQLFAQKVTRDDNQVLKVGICDLPPLMFMNNEDQPSGYFVDIIDSMMHRLNKKYEYVFYSESHLKEYAKKGMIDLYLAKSISSIVD